MKVTIKGKDYSLLYSMRAFEKNAKHFSSDNGNLEQVTRILYAGIENAKYREDVELDLSFGDVAEFVETTFFKDLESVKKMYEEVAKVLPQQEAKQIEKKTRRATTTVTASSSL